jgi:DNA-binding NarL/FixJ family response regulator
MEIRIKITDQEKLLIYYLSEGMSHKEIAGHLDMPERQFETLFINLRNKLGCRNGAHVVAAGFILGLLPATPEKLAEFSGKNTAETSA